MNTQPVQPKFPAVMAPKTSNGKYVYACGCVINIQTLAIGVCDWHYIEGFNSITNVRVYT